MSNKKICSENNNILVNQINSINHPIQSTLENSSQMTTHDEKRYCFNFLLNKVYKPGKIPEVILKSESFQNGERWDPSDSNTDTESLLSLKDKFPDSFKIIQF